MKYVFYGLIGLTILLIGFFSLSTGLNKSNSPTVAKDQTGKVLKLSATIRNRSYIPTSIDVPFGSMVELTVKNEDNEQHGLGIAGFGVQGSVGPLQTKTVKFEASQRGETNTVCSSTHPEKLIINVI